jgi:5-methyltetrahydrofolate--homocysteine methyltransferase
VIAQCARFDAPGRLRFVCGDLGPTTKAISVTGGISFDELAAHYRIQALGLMAGGADYLLLETCQDTRNVKAALIGIEQVGVKIPVIVSGTIEPMGTMLAGQTADALVASLQHVDLLAIGLNCATGPEFMTDHIRTMHEMATTAVSCYPNAGLPDEEGKYGETPTSLAASLERFVKNGWVNISQNQKTRRTSRNSSKPPSPRSRSQQTRKPTTKSPRTSAPITKS